MREWGRAAALAAAAVAATSVAILSSVACGLKRGAEPMPGGGDHEVTNLAIEARPAVARVGQPVRFKVTAVWAIPYVEDAAAKAAYEIVDAKMGKMTEPGVFMPAKAGTVRIVAVYEGATASIDLTVKE